MKRILAVLVSVLAFGLLVPAAGSAAPTYDQSCRIGPAMGASSTVRVANMSCRHGWKVTRKGMKKFCEARNDCLIDFEDDINYVYRGTVIRNGWKCKVANGWETYRVKCRKGKMRAIMRGGA